MFENKISVRELVEFILNSGDLDLSYKSNARAVEGTYIHQKIQNQYPDTFEKEVHLSHTFEINDFLIKVSGRADGLRTTDGLLLDEIKSTRKKLEDIMIDDNRVHWAQAKFYGWIYLKEHNLETIAIQLTYVETKDLKTKQFTKQFSFEALDAFVYDLLEQYIDWLDLEKRMIMQRNQSIHDLSFPFENYRKFQRKISVITYNNLKNGENVFIQAPTGIGKTMATLFPTIKGFPHLKFDKIFFLTAKTIARQVAEESIEIMLDEGLIIKSLTLTAKDKICFYEEADCDVEKCKYTHGYYDKVKDALREILAQYDLITRHEITTIASKYEICPFEFSLDISLFSDIIICDYNYVFDPRVRLKRFFDFNEYKIQLLIDESHNLVDRARSMYSTELYKQDLLELRRELKDDHEYLAKDLYKMNRAFLALKHDLGDQEVFLQDQYPEDFYLKVRQLVDQIDGWLQENKKDKYYQDVLELYFEYLHFIRIADLDFSGSKFYFRFIGNNNYIAKIFNIDPSIHLKQTSVESKTFFSATLSPINYYCDILGGKETDKKYVLPSPFDSDKRLVLFSDEISTRYKDRNKTLPLVAEYIHTFTKAKKGNYLIFFPSYEYLNDVKDVYYKLYGKEPAFLIQKRYMDELAREEFINRLKTDHGVTALGVMGGIFSEGIDLKGESLIGVMLVGIGLPKFNYENSVIRNYYDHKKNAGFEYAYTYPSIIKIMQAIGRVIRTENDQGAIVLLGDRFTKNYYRNYLPEDYGNKKITIGLLEKKLKEFWLSDE